VAKHLIDTDLYIDLIQSEQRSPSYVNFTIETLRVFISAPS